MTNTVQQREELLSFFCPGCKTSHSVQVGSDFGPNWTWNGSLEAPTFQPSVLVTGHGLTDKGTADYEAWCAAGCPMPAPEFGNAPTACHSFVTDGRIQFLSDCTHELAGQTVDLPPWPGSH